MGDDVGSEYNTGLSVNYVIVQDDASPEEKAIHEWLDKCGIFEVNVSMQIQDDSKSACSNSPESKKYWVDLQSKNRSSPSFLQKRRMQN